MYRYSLIAILFVMIVVTLTWLQGRREANPERAFYLQRSFRGFLLFFTLGMLSLIAVLWVTQEYQISRVLWFLLLAIIPIAIGIWAYLFVKPRLAPKDRHVVNGLIGTGILVFALVVLLLALKAGVDPVLIGVLAFIANVIALLGPKLSIRKRPRQKN